MNKIQCALFTLTIWMTPSKMEWTNSQNSFSSAILSKGSSLLTKKNSPVTIPFTRRRLQEESSAAIVRIPVRFPSKRVMTSLSPNSFTLSSMSGKANGDRWTSIGDPSSICAFLVSCHSILSANLKLWIETWNFSCANWTKVNWLDSLLVNRKPKRHRLCGGKPWNCSAQINWMNLLKCLQTISGYLDTHNIWEKNELFKINFSFLFVCELLVQ